MKKVLILAYDFPPYVSVGGLRPFNWYKYFHEFDIYPVVVTRQWENSYGNFLDYVSESKNKVSTVEKFDSGKLIRTPYKPNLSNRLLLKHGENKYKLIRKSITAYFEFSQFLVKTGPKIELYNSARKYLQNNQVDAIIATGDPFILFEYAAALGKEFDVPWIADYRDPWSQNKVHQRNFFFKYWNRFFEKKIVKSASQIITVSDFLKVTIERIIPNVPIHILPNGYDPEVIDQLQNIAQSKDSLQIAFVGTVYEWHPMNSFLKILNQFVIQNPEAKLKFNLFGINIVPQLEQLIHDVYPTLAPYITITPKIPNDILLKELAKHNVMLLFNYYSFMGTKIFDYIGIRRKIVMCYSNDPEALLLKEKYYTIDEIDGVSHHLQVDLIHETNSGIVVENENQLLSVLEELYHEFDTTSQIACDSVHVENYSRKIQVKQLASIIHSMKKEK